MNGGGPKGIGELVGEAVGVGGRGVGVPFVVVGQAARGWKRWTR